MGGTSEAAPPRSRPAPPPLKRRRVLLPGSAVLAAELSVAPQPLLSAMTVKAAEASGPALTYSKMRGMVAILIGEREEGCSRAAFFFFLLFFSAGQADG